MLNMWPHICFKVQFIFIVVFLLKLLPGPHVLMERISKFMNLPLFIFLGTLPQG